VDLYIHSPIRLNFTVFIYLSTLTNSSLLRKLTVTFVTIMYTLHLVTDIRTLDLRTSVLTNGITELGFYFNLFSFLSFIYVCECLIFSGIR
jgi:hypothetical protein